MARRCFEVNKLVITFNECTNREGKLEFVSEKMKKLLNKYASNTEFNISSKLKIGYGSETEVCVILAKEISVITVMTILSYMLGKKVKEIMYIPSDRTMKIYIPE